MRNIEYVNEKKAYVAVRVNFSLEGAMRPLAITWEDGREYEIDDVLQVKPKASTKAGGIGIGFECMIMGQRKWLYFEDPRWFMERK